MKVLLVRVSTQDKRQQGKHIPDLGRPCMSVNTNVKEEPRRASHEFTYKCTDSGEELGLHGLSLGETASNQNRVVRNLMWDFVRKTR